MADALGGTTGGDEKRRDISAPLRKGAVRRKKRRAAPDPRVKEVFEAMKADFGFTQGGTAIDPIPSYGKEGQAIKRMLARGFTPSDILSAWRGKVKRRGGFVSMVYVNEDIGKEVMRGKIGGHTARDSAEEFDWGGFPDTSEPL
jgi:hypothetical protein